MIKKQSNINSCLISHTEHLDPSKKGKSKSQKNQMYEKQL